MLKLFGILFIATTTVVQCKIFERCELAQVLKNANINIEHIPKWVCIAANAGLDSAVLDRDSSEGEGIFGLFQITEKYFCSLTGPGKICGIQCSQLIDGNLDGNVHKLTVQASQIFKNLKF